jgi:hypothetical protein
MGEQGKRLVVPEFVVLEVAVGFDLVEEIDQRRAQLIQARQVSEIVSEVAEGAVGALQTRQHVMVGLDEGARLVPPVGELDHGALRLAVTVMQAGPPGPSAKTR